MPEFFVFGIRQIDMAPLSWLVNLGHMYGSSLIFLLGLGYWIQGFRCFPWFAVNFYLKDVVAVDPGMLQLVQNTVFLPLVTKPMYGIISDAVYIRGSHRIPYIAIGGCLQAMSWGVIAVLPKDGASVTVVATLLALTNLGGSIVDVANDALVAECANKRKSTGELQSFAWVWTAAGGVLGNLAAAFAVGRVEFKFIFGIFGVLVLCQVAKSFGMSEQSLGLRRPHFVNVISDRIDDDSSLSPVIVEKQAASLLHLHSIDKLHEFQPTHMLDKLENGYKHNVERSDFPHVVMPGAPSEKEVCRLWNVIGQQLTDLIQLVKQPDIICPLSWFVSSYAMIPTLTGTMFFYQTQHLKVDPSVVGFAKVLGQLGVMAASAFYNRHLKHVSLRKLLASVQILACVCISSDILLVKRVNVRMGIPDYMMVMGMSAYVEGIHQFKVLPLMVLLGHLCPVGREGALLAVLMSMYCLSSIVSGYMGVVLASVLHISSQDFSELPTAIVAQALVSLLPLLWISFIPSRPRAGMSQNTEDGKST